MSRCTYYTPVLDTLGKRLRHWLIDAGLTQYELAAKLGVGKAAVSRWCVDLGMPARNTLPLLSEITGYSIDYLLLGPAESTPSTSSNENPEAKP